LADPEPVKLEPVAARQFAALVAAPECACYQARGLRRGGIPAFLVRALY
jgi:hypothetical protein